MGIKEVTTADINEIIESLIRLLENEDMKKKELKKPVKKVGKLVEAETDNDNGDEEEDKLESLLAALFMEANPKLDEDTLDDLVARALEAVTAEEEEMDADEDDEEDDDEDEDEDDEEDE